MRLLSLWIWLANIFYDFWIIRATAFLLYTCTWLVWSVAEHGPTELLVQLLRPILIRYNVTAYFSGHDHNAQHIHERDSTVEYFVTGAAHGTDPSLAHLVRL